VIALRSNIRWCSDHFELACRNGELLRVGFTIDACDREVIAWSATTAGISGEMVRDLMIACVERRFGTSKAPHLVEWLSDNGSAYIAKDTLGTATALGLRLCFTPVRSPESNGIAEGFVKTLKRDYARLSILPDAAAVIALLPAWFEDYNEVHPQSGLKFLSQENFCASVLSSTKLPVRSNGVHTTRIRMISNASVSKDANSQGALWWRRRKHTLIWYWRGVVHSRPGPHCRLAGQVPFSPVGARMRCSPAKFMAHC
jgi:hypothetical protein